MNLTEEFPIVRSDTLPENDATNFPDRGCRYSPSCLRCPLVVCVLDAVAWQHFKRAHDNSRAIMRALARGRLSRTQPSNTAAHGGLFTAYSNACVRAI